MQAACEGRQRRCQVRGSRGVLELGSGLKGMFGDLTTQEDRTYKARLLREIWGPVPFRRLATGTSWLTPEIRKLSVRIYDERAFDRLPALADVCEQARCEDKDLLTHLRRRRTHVRGCWALDLLLGNE